MIAIFVSTVAALLFVVWFSARKARQRRPVQPQWSADVCVQLHTEDPGGGSGPMANGYSRVKLTRGEIEETVEFPSWNGAQATIHHWTLHDEDGNVLASGDLLPREVKDQ